MNVSGSLFPFVWQVTSSDAGDRRIWPAGRYEVYLDDERLNGFHKREDAEVCVEAFPGAALLDRAMRQ